MIQYTAPILLLAVAATSVTVDETPAQKTPEIKSIAREFRIRTYDAFRTQRDEYNRRIELSDEALQRYRGANDARKREIQDWFVQSATAANLPSLPGGEHQSTEQIAESAADHVTHSVVFESPIPKVEPAWENESDEVNSNASEIPNETLSGEIDFDSSDEWEDTEGTLETSVVRNDKFGIASKSRTFSILNSVGRAVTFAVAKGASEEADKTADNEANVQFEPTDDAPETPDAETPDAETADVLDDQDEVIEDEPTLAVRHEDEITEEDFELEELILESPAGDSDDDLEPTPETFQHESSWTPKSSTRLARRIEKLEKSVHRITVRLDMPGMTVHQIEGAVELAEEMCWNYRTVATYLEATDGDTSIVDSSIIRSQVDRLADRLGKGLSAYKEAVKANPSISHFIVTLEELQLRAELLKGEVNA